MGNGLILGANELIAEILTLGEKSGIGANAAYGLIKGMVSLATDRYDF